MEKVEDDPVIYDTIILQDESAATNPNGNEPDAIESEPDTIENEPDEIENESDAIDNESDTIENEPAAIENEPDEGTTEPMYAEPNKNKSAKNEPINDEPTVNGLIHEEPNDEQRAKNEQTTKSAREKSRRRRSSQPEHTHTKSKDKSRKNRPKSKGNAQIKSKSSKERPKRDRSNDNTLEKSKRAKDKPGRDESKEKTLMKSKSGKDKPRETKRTKSKPTKHISLKDRLLRKRTGTGKPAEEKTPTKSTKRSQSKERHKVNGVVRNSSADDGQRRKSSHAIDDGQRRKSSHAEPANAEPIRRESVKDELIKDTEAKKDVRIELDKKENTYYASDWLRGKVIVNPSRTKEIREIILKFNGWHPSERYLSERSILYESDGSHEADLTYPFELLLPEFIPSSFEGEHAFVRYNISCYAIGFDWLTSETEQPFRVVRHLDLERYPQRPVQNSDRRPVWNFCCWSGPIVKAGVRLNKSAYSPGEDIIINAKVTNESNRPIQRTKVELIQESTYGHPYAKHKEKQVKVIAEKNRGGVDPNGVKKWVDDGLRVPQTPPSFLEGCKQIDIQYKVKFSAFPVGRSELEVILDILIGTRPTEIDSRTAEADSVDILLD